MTLELAQQALRRGDRDGAERLLRSVLQGNPTDLAAEFLLAGLIAASGRFDEARAILERIVAKDPSDARARMGLIELSMAEGDDLSARDLIEQLPECLGKRPEFQAKEAIIARRMGDREREIDILTELVALEPSRIDERIQLANAHASIGNSSEAEKHLRAVLSDQPHHGEAWRQLADLASGKLERSEEEQVREALASSAMPMDRIALNAVLFRIEDARGNHDTAFSFLREANALHATLMPPPPSGATPKVDKAIATYSDDFFAGSVPAGHASDEPIFIVGLPRSGSTLVEQILASHPDIEGTFELPVMPRIIRELMHEEGVGEAELIARVAKFDSKRLVAIGQRYLNLAGQFRREVRGRFTDKLTGNWSNIFLIRMILPSANLIDCRRHPMATGWSIFSNFFASNVPFQSDLVAIGQRYRAYLAMMEHYETVQPRGVHRVLHEELVADPDRHIRALLDHVGVSFDAACLQPHKTKRVVSTVSTHQVREPINAAGVDRWRHYEPYLKPLADSLGDAIERWDR